MNPEPASFEGVHVLAELWGVDAALLNNAVELSDTLHRVLKEANATVLQVRSETFDPQGVTCVAVLAESHATIHTYPEHGAAFVDFFTCGHSADPVRALRLLSTALGAAYVDDQVIRRGGTVSRLRLLRAGMISLDPSSSVPAGAPVPVSVGS